MGGGQAAAAAGCPYQDMKGFGGETSDPSYRTSRVRMSYIT